MLRKKIKDIESFEQWQKNLLYAFASKKDTRLAMFFEVETRKLYLKANLIKSNLTKPKRFLLRFELLLLNLLVYFFIHKSKKLITEIYTFNDTEKNMTVSEYILKTLSKYAK